MKTEQKILLSKVLVIVLLLLSATNSEATRFGNALHTAPFIFTVICAPWLFLMDTESGSKKVFTYLALTALCFFVIYSFSQWTNRGGFEGFLQKLTNNWRISVRLLGFGVFGYIIFNRIMVFRKQ